MSHADKHVWEFRWVRDLIVFAAVTLVLVMVYRARSVIAPAVLGLVLAYIANPVVLRLAKRPNWNRAKATATLLGGIGLVILVLALLLTPILIGQVGSLSNNAGKYAGWVVKQIEHYSGESITGTETETGTGTGTDSGSASESESESGTNANTDPDTGTGTGTGTQSDTATTPPTAQPEKAPTPPHPAPTTAPSPTPASAPTPTESPTPTPASLAEKAKDIDFGKVGNTALTVLNTSLSIISSVLGATTYLIIFAIITGFSFYFFSWRFDRILAWTASLIPRKSRTRTLEIIDKMDTTIAAFIRGRLIQSLVMGVVLSLGWWAVGVPYWLALGLAGGLLNLAPFAASFAWIVAVVLAIVDHLSGGSGDTGWIAILVGSVVLPTVVYMIGQGLDGYVVEPMVQGQATDLDPLSVLLAVMIGGTLAGLLGLIVAIPLAACIKILASEIILPAYRDWAHAPALSETPDAEQDAE